MVGELTTPSPFHGLGPAPWSKTTGPYVRTVLHFVLIGRGDRKMVGDLFTYLESSETAHQISRQVLQSFPILYQTEERAIAYCVEWSVYWSIYSAFDRESDFKKFCLGQLDPCLYYMNIFKKDANIWIQTTATETVI